MTAGMRVGRVRHRDGPNVSGELELSWPWTDGLSGTSTEVAAATPAATGIPVIENGDQPLGVGVSGALGTRPGGGVVQVPCGSRKSIYGGSNSVRAL